MTNGHPTPAETLDAAKQEMIDAKAILDDPGTRAALSDADKGMAAVKSLELGTAILQIENAQIAAIANRVEANGAALRGAIEELAEARGQIQDFTRLLNAATALLGLVATVFAI